MAFLDICEILSLKLIIVSIVQRISVTVHASRANAQKDSETMISPWNRSRTRLGRGGRTRGNVDMSSGTARRAVAESDEGKLLPLFDTTDGSANESRVVATERASSHDREPLPRRCSVSKHSSPHGRDCSSPRPREEE